MWFRSGDACRQTGCDNFDSSCRHRIAEPPLMLSVERSDHCRERLDVVIQRHTQFRTLAEVSQFQNTVEFQQSRIELLPGSPSGGTAIKLSERGFYGAPTVGVGVGKARQSEFGANIGGEKPDCRHQAGM